MRQTFRRHRQSANPSVSQLFGSSCADVFESVRQALIGSSSGEDGNPLTSLSPRARVLLEPPANRHSNLSLMDSPGSDKASEDSGSDSQSSTVSSPGLGSPRRLRKEGSPLSASWDTPLSGRNLLKESLLAAESRSNGQLGAFGSPLDHAPGRIHTSGLRLSYDRLLSADSPLGTPKIAKGRERHVDSPKESPGGSHDHGFSFSPGGVGSRHAPLLGSPLGNGAQLGGGRRQRPGAARADHLQTGGESGGDGCPGEAKEHKETRAVDRHSREHFRPRPAPAEGVRVVAQR